MKNFDLEAAKKGARVCTMVGLPVRILCFDIRDKYPIIAAILDSDGIERVYGYDLVGKLMPIMEIPNWLDYQIMMADDDYMEKLARGEYSTQATDAAHDPTTYMAPSTDPVPATYNYPVPFTYTDPWDEFKRQAALEILRQRGCFVGQDAVDGVIRDVNRLVEGLKGK